MESGVDSTMKVKAADRLGFDTNGLVLNKIVQYVKVVGCKWNLATGAFKVPHRFSQALIDSMTPEDHTLNNMTRLAGHPRLVKAISKLQGYAMQKEVDPMTEVLVTEGASGAIYCALQAFINPGDEVVVVEPCFSNFTTKIQLAGGKPICVAMTMEENEETGAASWNLDFQELREVFSSKTKAILLNTPNNPLGKVYTREELELIAELCRKYDVICIADEVYEWMIFPGAEHIRMASLPGMYERTITIGSASKVFNLMGWRCGWIVGSQHLIHPITAFHTAALVTCCTPIQEAIARIIEEELERIEDKSTCYLYTFTRDVLLPKRELMRKVLDEVGMKYVLPEGSYFLFADWSSLGISDELIQNESGDTRDVKFAMWLIKEHSLVVIPGSAFYCKQHKHLGENYIRLLLFVDDDVIISFGECLKSLVAKTT